MKTHEFLFKAFALCAVLGSLLLTGCNGKFPGRRGSDLNGFTLRAGVIDLDKTGTDVDSVTSSTVVLRNGPAVVPGNIIVHNELGPKRFVRKVVSADTVGDMTTVQTSEAGLEDVFATANISQHVPFTTDDLLKLQPAAPGVTFSAPGKSRSKGSGASRGDGGIDIVLANFRLNNDSDEPIVRVDGKVHLNAGIETRLDKSLISVNEFYVAPFVDIDGSLSAQGKLSGSFVREFPVSLNVSIPVTALGPLGINCDVQLMMRLEGSFDAQGQFVLKAGVHARAGVRYMASGGWQLINEFTPTLKIKPPTYRGALEMGVSLVRPKVAASVLGIGELHVTADVVKALARVSYQSAPVPGFLVEGLADFGFSAGGSLKIGPVTLWEQQKDFNLGSFQIMQPFLLQDLGPKDTYVAFCDPTLHTIHARDGDGSNDRVLVSSANFVYSPNVSNSTGMLCFAQFNAQGRGEIWVANRDGSGQRRITDGTLSVNHLQWDPTGSEIAFDATGANGVKQIYVVNVASGSIRQLTADTTASRIPCWTPDGESIYFEKTTASSKKAIAKTYSAFPSFTYVLVNDTIDYAEPSLSPNGLMLAVLRGGSEIVICDQFGMDERLVFGDPHLSRPTFSPDGLRLLLQYNLPGSVYVQSYDLYGGNVIDFGLGMQPSWGMSK